MTLKQLGPVLAGTRVLITAQRRASDLALALERRGASVTVAPSIGVESHIDEEALLAQTRAIIESGVEAVVLTTGIGFRGWLETAEAAGLGSRLVERVAGWARERGAPALTLTTYAEVAWNAPYYERLGFRRLADDELTPGLRAIRAAEAERGLDRWPRVGMRRELSA